MQFNPGETQDRKADNTLSEQERAGDDHDQTGAGRSRKKSVLVMDDEVMVRTITRHVLETQGYQVDTTENGTEAIERYQEAREFGAPFDVVIIDLSIPHGMGGRETIKKLLELDPGAQAIVASGNSSDPALTNFQEYGFKGALRKPFSIRELRLAVEDVLDTDGDVKEEL